MGLARHGVFFSPPAVDLTNLENATAAIPPRVQHVHGNTLAKGAFRKDHEKYAE